jgi:hypothetical protein
MIIDIRKIPTFWINLIEHTENHRSMNSLLSSHGFINHQRTPGIRVTGFEGKAYHQSINHYMGVGLAQLNAMRQCQPSLPSLILEDDVDITPHFNPILDIPDNTDAVYLGVSTAGNPFGIKINQNYARIFNVLAAHAIIYISPTFLSAAMTASKECLIDKLAPFDIAMSNLLSSYNVLTPIRPYFYQSNNKQSENKWEELTNKSLKIYDRNPTNI